MEIDSCDPDGAYSLIRFTDHSCIRILRDVQLRLDFFPGKQVLPEDIAAARAGSIGLECERKALDLIARAPHTVQGMRRKLRARDFEDIHIQAAVERLIELGYLSDRDYAENWLAQRIRRHPEGRRALVAGLMRRGIDRNLADEIVAESVSLEDERQFAREDLQRLWARESGGSGGSRLPAKARAALARKLYARGYDSQIVMGLLRESEQELGGDADFEL